MKRIIERAKVSSGIAVCVLIAYVVLLVISPVLTSATPSMQRGRPTREQPTRSASISLNPREGVPGTAGVRVEGWFFPVGSTCEVRWDDPDERLVGDVRTDTEGNFYVNVNIPSGASAGQHSVTANCSGTSAYALFWVIAATVTNTPATVAPSSTPKDTVEPPTVTTTPTWLAVTPIYPTAQGPVGAVALTPGAVTVPGAVTTPVKGVTTSAGGRATSTVVVRATATPVRPAASVGVPTVGWGIAPLLGGLILASMAILFRMIRISTK